MFVCSLSFGSFANNNGIKLGLGGLAFKNVYMQYERAFTDKLSAQVGFGFYLPFNPSETIEKYNVTINDFELSSTIKLDDRIVTIEEWSSDGFNVNAEFRYYFGNKDALKGLYIAPFAGYHKNNDKQIKGTDDSGIKYDGEVSFTYAGGGLQLGYQFLIANRLILDWRILGLGAGKYTIAGGYKNDETNHDFEERANEIEEFLGEDLGFDTSKFSTSFGDRVDSELSFVLPTIRLGLSIGFAF